MNKIKTIGIGVCLVLLMPVLVFAQTTTSSYNPAKDPKYNLGEGSNVNGILNFRMGTSGASLRFGTETLSGNGTQGVVVSTASTVPQIAVTYGAGSTTFNMKNMNVKVDGNALLSSGDAIAATSGAGSNTTLTNPTLEGAGHLSSGFTLTADGNTISDTEIKQLDGILNPIQTQLDQRVGSSSPRIGAITCGGTTTATSSGSSTVRFAAGGDLTSTMVDNGGGLFTVTTSIAGTATAKPDIKLDGILFVQGATFFNFSPDFALAANGDGVDIAQGANSRVIATTTAYVGTNTTTHATMQVLAESRYTPYDHDTNTQVLYHFDGPDNSNVYTDHSEYARHGSNVTNAIDTAQSKFGGSSLKLSGYDEYMVIPGGSYLNFSGDYAFDLQLRFSAHTGSASAFASQAGSGHQFYFDTVTSELVYTNAQNSMTLRGSWTPSDNTWYHLKVRRSGTNLNQYINGVQVGGTATVTGGALVGCGTATVYVGQRVNASPITAYLNAWVDEYRISSSARDVGEFTPPASDYHDNYNTLSYRFISPTEGEFMRYLDHGTETHFWGSLLIGTTTPQTMVGSTSVYSAETLNMLATAYTVRACSSDVKTSTEINPVKIEKNVLDSLEAAKIHQYRWNNPHDIRNNTDNYGIMIDDARRQKSYLLMDYPKSRNGADGYLRSTRLC